MTIRRVYGLLIVLWSLRCAQIAGPFIDTHPAHGAGVLLVSWATITGALLVLMPFTRWLADHWSRA